MTSGSGCRLRPQLARAAIRPRWSARRSEVAESILRYYDLGVTSILIRGFRPYEDVIEYGREIVPLVQAEVARRDAERAKQAAEPALAAV